VIDLDLTGNQQMLRDLVRDFAEHEIAPAARTWDREARFPMATVKRLGELGLLGVNTAAEYGGAEAGTRALALVVEEVARHDGSLALTVASHNGLAQTHINLEGNAEQKGRYLPDIAAGRKLCGWGLTEPGSGSDAGAARTRAVKKGDRWILNGSKMFITQGTVGEVFVVMASTSPERKQYGLSAFIVERGWRGFGAEPIHGKLGMRSSDTAVLTFEDVEVPEENRLGAVDDGFRGALKVLDRGRITIAALGVGLIRGALEESCRYAQQRVQFEQPLASFQAIQFMLADMSVAYQAASLLTAQAALRAEAGRPFKTEAAAAKLYASEAAMLACTKAVQIHGGYGYTDEFPVERYLRDARLLEIGEGTSEVQRMVLAREVLKG
jgi:alkylation response protein AidB-like acyl-CoA dehydrogenase